MKLFGINLNKGLVILNILETAGLAIWLALVTNGQGLLGFGVLSTFLFAEHVVGFNNFHRNSLFSFIAAPITKLLTITLLEAGVWAGWLALIMSGHGVLSGIVLLAGLAIHHVTELNVFRKKAAFSNFGPMLEAGFGFTIIESLTGIIWRVATRINAVLAIAVLFIGLLIEHDKSAKVLEELD